MFGLKVATAEGDPIRRTTSSRLCAPTSSFSTEPGVAAKPRWSTVFSQPPRATAQRAMAPTRASGAVRRMDCFLALREEGQQDVVMKRPGQQVVPRPIGEGVF